MADTLNINDTSRSRNPKWVQREVWKTGTEYWDRNKITTGLQEQLKIERKAVSREQREAEKQRQFELKQHKKKEKHSGDEIDLGF